MDRRFDILDGNLYTPEQLNDIVDHPEFDTLFQALWYNYLLDEDKTTSIAYWSDRFNDEKAFVMATKHLSESGWAIVKLNPARNWGTIKLNGDKLLKWLSKDELKRVRKTFKYSKYLMPKRGKETSTVAKTAKGKREIGLIRTGTAIAGKNKFQYDTDMIHKYYDAIVKNVTKSMKELSKTMDIALNDETGYTKISKEVVDAYMYGTEEQYCMGEALMDSRGRAIFEGLGKVGNPIGYKDFRALLKIEPRELTADAMDDVYLFVAELLSLKATTVKRKIKAGKKAYGAKTLPEVEYSSKGYPEDLEAVIWLDRVYNADPKAWDVVIELDATASALQFVGALLNEERLLDQTNVIGKELKDIWTIDGLSRLQVKKAMTPRIYGSTASPVALWKKNKLDYKRDQAKIVEKELYHGALGVANDFKDFIINNVDPKPEMVVNVFGENFSIYCNRYHKLGEYTKPYVGWDTNSREFRVIKHTHTKNIADLDQFRRYFVTLLIHNLDSQVADRIAGAISWVIPIYDAFLVHPNDAKEVRRLYSNELFAISENREVILRDYFNSIGIDLKNDKRAIIEWGKLQEKIKKAGKILPQPTALK